MKYFYLSILFAAIVSPIYSQADGPHIVRNGACGGYTLEVNSIAYDNGSGSNVSLFCWDVNGNGIGDPAEDTNQDGVFNVLDCAGGPGCWDINGNGVGDAAEDINGDGVFDIFDCPTCWDTNFNGAEDPSEDTNGDGVWDANDCPPIETGGCTATPIEDVALVGTNTLEIFDDNSYLNGISTLDLVLILRWLFDGFPGPLETITSDWDGDGVVSTSDYIEMRRMILGIDVDNNYNNYFVVPDGFVFPNVDPFDMNVDYTSMNFEDADVVDNELEVFVFKAGDVNQSAFLIGDDTEVSSRARKEIVYEDAFLKAGEMKSIPFSISNDDQILGTTFRLMSSDLVFGELITTENQSSFLTNEDGNQIAISYINNAKTQNISFTIDVMADSDGFLSEFLDLDDTIVPEMVDGNDREHGLVLIAASSSSTQELDFENILIYPNPISDLLQIQFKDAQERTVALMNTSGQRIFSELSEGTSLQIKRTQEMIPGLYLLTVDSETESNSYRVVMK